MYCFNYLHCLPELTNEQKSCASSFHVAFLPKIYLNVMLLISPSVSPLKCPVYSARHMTEMTTFNLHVLRDDLNPSPVFSTSHWMSLEFN
jgi:hypothetical protein